MKVAWGCAKFQGDTNSNVLSSVLKIAVVGNSCFALLDPFYSGGI